MCSALLFPGIMSLTSKHLFNHGEIIAVTVVERRLLYTYTLSGEQKDSRKGERQ